MLYIMAGICIESFTGCLKRACASGNPGETIVSGIND